MSYKSKAISLPTHDLPASWSDEARMNVLFAPFRSRSANPHDWESKLTFWKNLICQTCVHSKVYTFYIEDLRKIFTKDGRSPSCLDDVIEELRRNGDVQPLDQFVSQMSPPGWGKWMTDIFVKKPMIWSYGMLKNKLIGDSSSLTKDRRTVLVDVLAIKKEAKTVLTQFPDNFRDRAVTFKELLDVVDDGFRNNVDSLKLILHYLRHEGAIAIRELDEARDATTSEIPGLPSDNILVKLGEKTIVTDADMSIYMLQQKEKSLCENIESLERDLQKILAEAKAYLQKGHRQLAKNTLRKKREVENRIIQRGNTLNNITILLSKVKDSHSDAEVLQVYKQALANFKDTGLSEDAVLDTMDDLTDLIHTNEDIQSMLGQNIGASLGSDEELEQELAELMANDENSTPPKPPPLEKVVKKEDKEEEKEDHHYKDLENRLKKLRMPLDLPEDIDEANLRNKPILS